MKKLLSAAIAVCALASPAVAEIKTQSENGFSLVHSADVLAKPEDVWKRLIAPKEWWNPEHSWSGSVAGFTIEPRAGGCFCENMQEKGKDGQLTTRGTVEHMRVIYVDPNKVLRMQGALGPLQSEALLGTFTVAMEALKSGGTKISFSYVVGGYYRYKTNEIAPSVDKVIGEQFARLISPLGKVVPGETKADQWSLDLSKIEDKPKVGKPEKVEPDLEPPLPVKKPATAPTGKSLNSKTVAPAPEAPKKPAAITEKPAKGG